MRWSWPTCVKNTPLQVNISFNMTCLVPTSNPDVGAPERLGLLEILRHFLIFRHEVVTRRLEHELAVLSRRLHILEGFALVFDALDEIIAIIRKSEGKADAAKKIMAKFKQLDAEQTEAILELKLYRLARLEINLILDEQKAKAKRAKEIEKLLKDDESDYTAGRWGLVRGEIEALLASYADKGRGADVGRRKTALADAAEEPAFDEADFIVEEDAWVLLSADGWVKRQKSAPDLAKAKVREGDSVLACMAGSTAATVLFFSNLGTCYTARIVDIPATTGHGEPIQKLFKLKDGEKIIAACSSDKRLLKKVFTAEDGDEPKPGQAQPAGGGFQWLCQSFVSGAIYRTQHPRRSQICALPARMQKWSAPLSLMAAK